MKSRAATDLGFIGEANIKQWPINIKELKSRYPARYEWKRGSHLEHALELLK